MTHRQPVLDLLERYREHYPEDAPMAEKVRELVAAHEDCFERTCLPGHLTGAAFIVSDDYERILLTHHKKLNLWLQLGGHADGDNDLVEVALREAQGESGMDGFDLVSPGHGEPIPLDIDVHRIPAYGGDPEHEHHDIRFLLVAWPDEQIVVSEESHEVRWVRWDEIEDFTTEVSILRMAKKAKAWLAELRTQAFDFGAESGDEYTIERDA